MKEVSISQGSVVTLFRCREQSQNHVCQILWSAHFLLCYSKNKTVSFFQTWCRVLLKSPASRQFKPPQWHMV